MLNTLNVASSGLAVAREQVENVMNNIANENTPGYKKRVVGISEAEHSDSRLTGRGALVGDTTRISNMYMYDNLTLEKSKQLQYDELSTMLADIEAIFYETDDSGLASDLDRYFQSLENLRASPDNEIYKNDLRNSGQILVNDLKTIYEDIEAREVGTKNNVVENVKELNAILNDIGEVNKIITESGYASNDLLDKRDQLEQELSKYIDIKVDRTNNYELKIAGMTAVRFDTNIHKVTVEDKTIAQRDIYADDMVIPFKSTLVNETKWGEEGDTVTYKLDNINEVSIRYGETVSVPIGTVPETYTDIEVTKDNVVRAMVAKINITPEIALKVTAYNGQYELDKDGNKILTNDPLHSEYDSVTPNKERYLVIESDIAGDKGEFVGKLIVEDDTNTDGTMDVNEVVKNSVISIKGTDDVHLAIFDRELSLKSGKLKPLTENLTTTSNGNLFTQYKDKLDELARSISDMAGSFIENSDGTYVSGNVKVDLHNDRATRVDIGLFTGSSVDTLVFNDGKVTGLTQDKLDYLSTMQWNKNIDFDGTGKNNTSFSDFNQTLRVQVSEDKENVDFRKSTQDAVTESLQNSYDKLTKVDKDEEMMNLIKFQAAYEANAKLITLVDEMLATILGIRR